MYRALEIQHHLVQEPEHLNERPDIPGLTPIGFERWQTLMIQAHPEEEFERLKKAMLEMPINNPDDKKERFPKDISRRLFPTTEDLPTRERLIRAMEEHARVTISRVPTHDTSRRSTQYNVVPPHRKPSDSSLNSDRPFGNSIERERQPYSNPADYESPIEDESNLPTPQPIERERQPYRATPGGGRVYEDTDGRNTGPSVPPPPPPPQSAPLHRANSTSTRPLNIPPPPATRPPEINQHHHHASISGRRRNHSPAPVNDFRRSDSDIRTFQPGSYGSSTIDDYEIDPRRYPRDTELRRGEYGRGPSPSRRYESERRATGHEEDYYRNAPRRDPNGRPGYNATR